MSNRRGVAWLALALAGPGLLPACASAPAAPPVSEPAAPAAPLPSASPAPAPAPAASASVAPAPSAAPASCGEKEVRDAHGRCVVAVCPQGQVLGSDGTCRAPPPCLDGEEMMGACICPHGKSVDETGHCVFAPCPPGATGGPVFRDEETGECKECRPGTVPCGSGCCPGGPRRR